MRWPLSRLLVALPATAWASREQVVEPRDVAVSLLQLRHQLMSSDLRVATGDATGSAVAKLPRTMKQAFVNASNPEHCAFQSVTAAGCDPHLERLQVRRVPVPRYGSRQALVRVAASSVNPTDWKSFLFRQDAPRGLGHDFAGVVAAVGSECGGGFAPGAAVWGVADEAYQEYIAQPCNRLGRKAANTGFLEAGASGIVTLTGLQGLRWAGAPWKQGAGPTVLVLGGSGGTGHVGIQLAKALGAGRVITTCSPDNADFVRSLGADEVIDYHKQDWWEVLATASVDVIYDCICLPGTGDHAYDVLAEGGRFITLLDEARVGLVKALARPDLSQYYFIVDHTKTADLDVIAGLQEARRLNITIDRVFSGLASAPALLNASMDGHTVGKLALRVAALL